MTGTDDKNIFMMGNEIERNAAQDLYVAMAPSI